MAALRQSLAEAGYVDGRNVALEPHWAEGQYDRLPAMVSEMVRRQVAVIIATGGTAPALAAKAATTTTPLVFSVTDDPVALGLVASLARPGGNATGVTFLLAELGPKQLGLLRELVPAATRIGLLINPNNTTSKAQVSDVVAAAGPSRHRDHGKARCGLAEDCSRDFQAAGRGRSVQGRCVVLG
jgi:putative tryptophan/tyrosine transport system substrate-binding protein